MKRRLYIYALWAATCCVLLAMVVTHHHHLDEVCTIMEQCDIDGQKNDLHTEHHKNKQDDSCALQQMNHYIINARTVHAVVKSLVPTPPPLLAVLPDEMRVAAPIGITLVCWQETATAGIIAQQQASISRRGPPIL